MRYDPQKHHRRSIRLPHHDYREAGAYFVTLCTYQRACLFGKIIESRMHLNDWGQIVKEEWLTTGNQRKDVHLDEYIVMPNHFHGIIILDKCKLTEERLQQFSSPQPNSLSAIVRLFKSSVTRRINALSDEPKVSIWQRSYYERVLRAGELDSVRSYIQNNPARWQQDNHFSPD